MSVFLVSPEWYWSSKQAATALMKIVRECFFADTRTVTCS